MISVLIADDNPVMRTGLVSLLGHEADLRVVGEAASGAEVLAQARRLRPDVVLLDICMPEMDGVTVATQLSAMAHVLMLTYVDDEASVTAALRAGASGYLVHGQFSPEQLVDAVRDLAGGGTVIAGTPASVLVEALRKAPVQQRSTGEFGLTKREAEVMEALAAGKSNRAIAEALYLSEKTVKNHLNRIYGKLDASSRGEAIAIWLGVVPTPRPRTGSSQGHSGGLSGER